MSTRAAKGASGALTRTIYVGLLVMLALLPFHAFGVTSLGRALGWTTADSLHPAMATVAGWKELLLVVLLCCMAAKAWIDRAWPVRFLASDAIVLGLLVLGLVQLPFQPAGAWLLGLRTDFVMFAPYVLARVVPWGAAERRTLWTVLLASGALALFLGVLHGLLPQEWLVRLGYAPYESSWVPEKPLPLFHTFEGTDLRRWMSTLAGPNQYAAYLLILLGLGLGTWLARRAAGREARGAWTRGLAGMVIAASAVSLVFTGSRGAALGFVLMLGLALWVALRTPRRRLLALAGVVLALGVGLTAFRAAAPETFHAAIVRTGSTGEHAVKFREGLRVIADHPAGLGLGQAGPVSRRARSVALGGDDGLVSESWYLQIGQELGIAGLLLMLALLWSVLARCFRLARQARDPDLRALAWGTGLAGAGICVQALVLHTFADNIAVSLTLWTLFGIIAERSMGFVAPTSTLKSKALHALSPNPKRGT